jgi:hypothetical protein
MINGSAINSAAINTDSTSSGGTPQPSADRLSVPITLTVSTLPTGSLSTPISLAVLPVSLPAEGWDVRVLVGGVDLSNRVEGELEIEAEKALRVLHRWC